MQHATPFASWENLTALRETTALQCPHRPRGHSTCATLPHFGISRANANYGLAPKHHSGPRSHGSPISHANHVSCPVGNRCYPKRCAVCPLVAQRHTFPSALADDFPLRNKKLAVPHGNMPTATTLVPVQQPGSRHTDVEAVPNSPQRIWSPPLSG